MKTSDEKQYVFIGSIDDLRHMGIIHDAQNVMNRKHKIIHIENEWAQIEYNQFAIKTIFLKQV